jgi:hypothetical protein
MNTATACLPCFKRMIRREAQLACPGDEPAQARIVETWERRLSELDLRVPPPVIARHLVDTVAAVSGNRADHYADDKRQANDAVLRLLPGLRTRIMAGQDNPGYPLALALELSVIGNYIDRGVDLDVDWEAELEDVARTLSPDVLILFEAAARPGARVVMLGDNAGEIALDTLLVEALLRRGCEVVYAVRSRAILNDATMEDAAYVGMTRLCPVVESGADTPGTVLDRCAPEFRQRLGEADVILSKGQGNYESLQGELAGVYCAFKVKCQRLVDETGLRLGDSAFIVTKATPVRPGRGVQP